MITTIQQQSANSASSATALQPPAWLMLEKGEALLASYPGKQIGEVVIYATLAVLSLCCIVALLMLAVGQAGKDIAGILTSVGGGASGMVISLGKLKKTLLHVTSKMLIFAEGKKAAGVPLADVAALKPGDGSRWTIGIYVKGQAKPIGKITVLNTDRVTAELTEYCRSGGARLAGDSTARGRG